MKMTPVRKNIVRLVKECIDRAYARHVAKCKRYAITNPRLWSDAPCEGEIDKFFTYFGGLPSLPTISSVGDRKMADMLNVMIRCVYTNDKARREFEKDLLADLREHGAEYELLSNMPAPKREYERRGPRSLVERRADTVDEKVREWERKLKLAKTKLAAYQKKQKYYQKKGAVV